MKSSLGIQYVLGLLYRAKIYVQGGNEISKYIMEELYQCLGTDRSSPAIMCGVYNDEFLKAKSSGPKNEDEIEVEKDTLVRYLTTTAKNFTALLKEQIKREQLLMEAQLRSLSLPDEPALERILRYETTIERQLYRALEQLERLQRQRKGDIVPPPLRLSVQT
jgi:hypothetical protein